jgi:hypothetical protein
MNLKQIYSSATPEERLEILLDATKPIESRKEKLILVHGRLIRERRQLILSAHFVHDRRSRIKPRAVLAGYFLFVFLIASVGVALSTFHFPPAYAAPLVLVYLTAFCAMLIIKPHTWHISYATNNRTNIPRVSRCPHSPKRSEVRILSPRQ